MEKLCACGCGKIVNKGNKYILGHNRAGLASCTVGDRWAMKYDCCSKCDTTDFAHAGKGLCTACYREYRYQSKKNGIGKWAKHHDKCIQCGLTTHQHKAKGMCVSCYGNLRRANKGVRVALKDSWSRFSKQCLQCGTTDIEHSANGLCCNCHNKYDRDLDSCNVCPVCGVMVEKLNQHLSMKAKKCDNHLQYQNNMFKTYFESDLSLDDIVIDMGVGAERHGITKQFVKLFGQEATDKRNKAVKSCYCSEKAAVNYNRKNRFGTVIEYNSPNQGPIRLRSKLEAAYADYLTASGYDWVYEVRKFNYIDVDGKRRTYTPDFYLIEEDKFVEIKGFEKTGDLIKLQVVRQLGIEIDFITQKELKELVRDAII